MALVAKTYVFSDGQVVSASQHNTNFDTLYTVVNGNLDSANFKSGAGIEESKITFSGSGHDHSGDTKGANVDVSSFSLTDQAKGAIIYYTGTAWAVLGTGTAGQVLTMSSGLPVWA